jgi:hypothetical protein
MALALAEDLLSRKLGSTAQQCFVSGMTVVPGSHGVLLLQKKSMDVLRAFQDDMAMGMN